ncbi:hypothetical protein JCM30237_08000 [Halolamina litorea]|uniref:Uncharacterized protein n=1 Tax=Halolamina litorea TaxID=1515593 RepID=A0ABD6BQK7_9EURY|nr:hypothetical protein [Halolamina litorea]
MTDRRDPEAEELRERLDELETTLVALREELDDGSDATRVPRGLLGGGRRPPRPPRLSEVLRFTEEYTIPTVISVLETNIRLLKLGGAALRAVDPERSTLQREREGAVSRALDAGRGFSTDRLADGLADLNEAVSGTEATDPEARELLSEAEELSAEIQERLREAGGGHRPGSSTRRGESERDDGAVHIDVTDGREEKEADETDESVDDSPQPDVDAELDSIREEVRGSASENTADERTDDDEPGDDANGNAPE